MKSFASRHAALYVLRTLCAASVLGFIFFTFSFASAAETTWTKGSLVRQTGGGALYNFTKAGEIFRAKAVALSDDGSTLVAYTNTTAFEPGYFVSVDGGATWTDRTYASGSYPNGGFRFGAVSGDGSRFFAIEPVYQNVGGVVHTGYALKVSFDNGATWGGLTFPVAGGDNARYVSSRCFDQACRVKRMSMDEWGPLYTLSRDGGKLLYVANWSGDDACSGACQSIWISNDGGNSWFKSKEWKGGSQRKALSMTLPPAYSDDGNTIMLVGSSNGVVSETSRLFFSRDGGVSWNERDFGEGITSMAAPGNGATMLVTLYNKIYKTTDGGTSWSSASVPVSQNYTDRVTTSIKALAGNGSLMLAGVAGNFPPTFGGFDFDGPTRLPFSFDQGKAWSSASFPDITGGLAWDMVFGVSRNGNKVVAISDSTTLVSAITKDSAVVAVAWTQYCTGGSDPNGKHWQWWEKSNTNPAQYRFVRPGDGLCAAPTLVAAAKPTVATSAKGKIEATPDGVCEMQGVDGYTTPVCPVTVTWSSSAKQTTVKVRYINTSTTIVPERTLVVNATQSSGTLKVKIPLGESVFGLYDASVSPNQIFAGWIYKGIQWTQYCTGGSDPNGNHWQWWSKSNTNPAQYRFSRAGDGECAPRASGPAVPKSPTPTPTPAPAPMPAISAPTQTLSGSIAATACTVSSGQKTCGVSVSWQSANSKDGWTQVNVVTSDGKTVDSYKVQRANASYTFMLPPGLYAFALIGFQQNNTPVILKSASATVGAAPVPAVQAAGANKTPFGYFDIANCTELKGWAYDPDDQNASIKIRVYEGSVMLAAGDASMPRADVNNVMRITGNHGFTIPTPAMLKDGKAHTLTLYAIDATGGANATLQQSPRTITCTPGVGLHKETTSTLLASVLMAPGALVIDTLATLFIQLGIVR